MNKSWEKDLLRVSQRKNELEQEEFLSLIDQALGKCTLEVARVLMKTFHNQPDYGTQERVISVLSTADNQVVIQAILEELPRLIREAPEWAESLIGLEVDKRTELLQEVALRMPEKVREDLRKLLIKEDFQVFYPKAKEIVV